MNNVGAGSVIFYLFSDSPALALLSFFLSFLLSFFLSFFLYLFIQFFI